MVRQTRVADNDNNIFVATNFNFVLREVLRDSMWFHVQLQLL